MAKTATINMRVDPEIKAEAEGLFAEFGMTLTEAMNIFLHKAIMEGGLPFAVRLPRPNAETLAAMQEARNIASGEISAKEYRSVEELMADLDADDSEDDEDVWNPDYNEATDSHEHL